MSNTHLAYVGGSRVSLEREEEEKERDSKMFGSIKEDSTEIARVLREYRGTSAVHSVYFYISLAGAGVAYNRSLRMRLSFTRGECTHLGPPLVVITSDGLQHAFLGVRKPAKFQHEIGTQLTCTINNLNDEKLSFIKLNLRQIL